VLLLCLALLIYVPEFVIIIEHRAESDSLRKDYGIGTLHYNWSMCAHAHRPSARTLQHVTVPIRNIYLREL